MRILYVSNEYPPDTGFGGIGTYTMHMAEAMAGRGHEVHVACRSASGKAHDLMQNAVHVHRVAPGTHPLPSGRAWYPLRQVCRFAMPGSLNRLAWTREVAMFVRAHHRTGSRFDVIEYPECNGEGYLLPRHANTVRIARLHTPWQMIRALDHIAEPRLDRLITNHMESGSTRAAHAVSCPSQALAKRLQSMWHIREPQLLPNPLPCNRYPQTQGRDWVFVGRIERVKGVSILLDAYASLPRENLPMLTLIGRAFGRHSDGTAYDAYLRRRISDLGVAHRVQWLEGVAHDRITEHLARSSALIIPSLWENCPYACLEAMASGLTVVASRTGGLPELVDEGVTGMLFETGSAKSLTATLGTLLTNPDACERMGTAARAWVRAHHDAPIVAEQTESFYASLMGSNRP